MPSRYDIREDKVEIMRSMSLFNKEFMNVALEDKAACEHILRILTKIPDLVVIQVTTQKRVVHTIDRDIVIDVLAEDSEGRLYNIEIQRTDTLNHAKRIRFHRSEIDSKLMEKGASFDDLPELYIIYISETNILQSGFAWDEVQSVFRRSGATYSDGSHIIFVNAAVDEGDDVSQLMKYFKTADPNDFSQGALSDYVHLLKATEEGASIMSEQMKMYLRGAQLERAADDVINLMDSAGVDMNKAMDWLKVANDERDNLKVLIHERMAGKSA